MAQVESKVLKCKDYLLADLDDSKLVYVLKKLLQLEVTIDILQKTGIGKIVNALRKRNGTVADRAKELVAKWKEMASAEQARLQEVNAERKVNENSVSFSDAKRPSKEILEHECEKQQNETLGDKIVTDGKHMATAEMFNKSKSHQRHYRNKHSDNEQSEEVEEIPHNRHLTSGDQRKEKNSKEKESHTTSDRNHSYTFEGGSHSRHSNHQQDSHDISLRGDNEHNRDHLVKDVHSSHGDRNNGHDVADSKGKHRNRDSHKSNIHHSKLCNPFEKNEILKTDKIEYKGHKSKSLKVMCDTDIKHSDSDLKSDFEMSKHDKRFSTDSKHQTKEHLEKHGGKSHHERTKIDRDVFDAKTLLHKDKITDIFAEKQERLKRKCEIGEGTKLIGVESDHFSKAKEDNKRSSKHGKDKDMHTNAEKIGKHSSHTGNNVKEKLSNETDTNIGKSKDTDRNERERKYIDESITKENLRRDRDKISSLPIVNEHKSRSKQSKSTSGLNKHQRHSSWDVKTQSSEMQEPHFRTISVEKSDENIENEMEKDGSNSNTNLSFKKSNTDLNTSNYKQIEKHKKKDSNRKKYHNNSKSDASEYVKDSKCDMVPNKVFSKSERSRSHSGSSSARTSRSSSVKSERSQSFDSDKELKMYQSVTGNGRKSSSKDHQISLHNKASKLVSHSSSKHCLDSEKPSHSEKMKSVLQPFHSDYSDGEIKKKPHSDSKDHEKKYDGDMDSSSKRSKSSSLIKSVSKDKPGAIKARKHNISEYSCDISNANTKLKQDKTSFAKDSDNDSDVLHQEINFIDVKNSMNNQRREMSLSNDKHEPETRIDEAIDRKCTKSHKNSSSHTTSHEQNYDDNRLKHGKKGGKEKLKHKSKKEKHKHKSSNSLRDRHRSDVANFADMLCFDNSDAIVTENVQSPVKKLRTSETDDKSNRYGDIHAKFKVIKLFESKTLGLGGKVEGLKRKATDDRDAPVIKRQASAELASYLPSTQANYRPWRFVSIAEKSGVDELDTSSFLKARNTRTAVYAGKKHNTVSEVHSLFDLCMKVLLDHIDAIDYVGGIPFSILKPVLEKCTPTQLYEKEDYNPHFLEDTDYLWKIHCERDFKGSNCEELETWRELYLRKMDEKNEKLKSVRAHISKSIAKAAPVRKTQLAFIDKAVKPPREVRRMQAKYGTSNIIQKANGKKHYPAFDMISIGRAKQQLAERARKAPMMRKTLHMVQNLHKR